MIVFKVGNSALFEKKDLTPSEFGREITQLGFMFGASTSGAYLSGPASDHSERAFISSAKSNPGFLQLLYANLVTGSFYCYAKVMLRAGGPVLKDVEAGIKAALAETPA